VAGPESGSRIWPIAVLVLVVVDVVLVAVVLGMRSGSSTATTAVTRVTSSASAGQSGSPSPTPSTRATGSSSPTPSTRPSPSPPSNPSSAVPVRRLLVAVDDRRAWRVSTGTCAGGGASVSLTTDGGRSWHARTTPLASISRLVVPPGATGVFAVGADGGCGAQLRRSVDSGATWADATGLGGFFYTDPGDPGSVAVPGRDTVQACGGQPILDLAVDAGGLEVLCPGGQLRSIGDGDATWTDGPRISGAVALTTSRIDPARTYVARVGQTVCAGVQIVDTGRLADPVTCVPRTDPITPGSVSLSVEGTAGWLLVGGDVYNSGNSLDNWVEP